MLLQVQLTLLQKNLKGGHWPPCPPPPRSAPEQQQHTKTIHNTILHMYIKQLQHSYAYTIIIQ